MSEFIFSPRFNDTDERIAFVDQSDADRLRLEREVIKAVKMWRNNTIVDEPLKEAVDRLLSFEAEQT